MKKLLLIVPALCLSVVAFAQWTSQATGFGTPSRGIRDVSVVDANTVWVCTYDGSGGGAATQDFSRTVNGGTTWVPGIVSTAPATYDWSSMWAISATTAWACFYDLAAGAGGGIFKTTDGGVTWNQQGTGLIFNATSFPDFVHFKDANNGFAVGDPNAGYYEIWTTTNGGTTWTRTPTANIPAELAGEFAVVNDFHVMGNTIWFGTNKGRAYKSIDYGLTWTVAVVTPVATTWVNDLYFRNATDGLATLWDGATTYSYRRTTDGGTTWAAVTPVGTYHNSDMDGTGNTYIATGAAAGNEGSAYSVDGGTTWVTIDAAVQHTAQGWANGTTGWSGGFNIDAITDGIFEYSGTALGVLALNRDDARMRVFPNPTNGQFTVQIGGAELRDATVNIIDIVGNVVFSKDISNSSSVIEESINLSDIAKGVYFVTVKNGTTLFTDKLVIE